PTPPRPSPAPLPEEPEKVEADHVQRPETEAPPVQEVVPAAPVQKEESSILEVGHRVAAGPEIAERVGRRPGRGGRASQAASEEASLGKHRGKHKATFYIDAELFEEVRDAVYALSGPPEQMTLARFATDAFTAHLKRLRQKHNDGDPFLARGGELSPGPRVR